VPAVFPGGEVVDARPCLPYGVLFLPEPGEKVWVQFEGGEPTLALWTGVQQTGDAWPKDPAPPDARTLRSHADHRLVLDDGTPAVELRYGGKRHAVAFTDTDVVIRHDSGHAITLAQDRVTVDFGSGGPTVTLQQSSAAISLGASSVTVDGAGVTVSGPLVKLGGAAAPVVRAGIDLGVGNLGAPVVITPGQFQVLA
jgi:hypothetical protein